MDVHWATVAACFSNSHNKTHSRDVFGAFAQRLPGFLETEARFAFQVSTRDAAIAARDTQIAELTSALVERDRRSAELTHTIAERDLDIEALRVLCQVHSEQARAILGSTSWKVTAPLRWARGLLRGRPADANIIRFEKLGHKFLNKEPYCWAFMENIFAPPDARSLVTTFPRDHFKTVKGHDGEKGYEYEVRPLIHMGASVPSFPEELSGAWSRLAHDLVSPSYRAAVTRLTGHDLMTAPMEAYVCHFGPGAWLGPHLDLKDKIMTQVFYFNELGSQGRRLFEHLAVSRHVRLDCGNSADRWKLVGPGAREQFLAFGVTRRERMPHVAAQHERDLLPSRCRQLDVAAGRPDAASSVRAG